MLILTDCRPGDVRRDQDGERQVKGLRDREVRLSGERREGLQVDERIQDKRPRGGRPHRPERLKLRQKFCKCTSTFSRFASELLFCFKNTVISYLPISTFFLVYVALLPCFVNPFLELSAGLFEQINFLIFKPGHCKISCFQSLDAVYCVV